MRYLYLNEELLNTLKLINVVKQLIRTFLIIFTNKQNPLLLK